LKIAEKVLSSEYRVALPSSTPTIVPDSTMSFLDFSISQDLVDPAGHIFELCPIQPSKNA